MCIKEYAFGTEEIILLYINKLYLIAEPDKEAYTHTHTIIFLVLCGSQEKLIASFF